MSNLLEDRIRKRDNWEKRMGVKYPSRFEKKHSSQIIQTCAGNDNVSVAGRIIKIRKLGRIAFMDIKDDTGIVQVSFTVIVLGNSDYKFYLNNLDIGDIIGVHGKISITQREQKTVEVSECILLSKALKIIPYNCNKIKSAEFRVRHRYLDLLINDETKKLLETRNRLIKYLRYYLEHREFFEVETPILQSVATGASAKPFVTHHNSLDMTLFLRIGHEPYLKRLMVGGYEKLFEIGKCFRNEGIDASRLQEFTLLEYYVAYWNYKDNICFVHDMIQACVKHLLGDLEVEYQGIKIDFSGDWPEITYRDLILRYTTIDIDITITYEDLIHEIKNKEIDIDFNNYVTYSSLLDALYKKFARVHIIQPTFVTEYPTELVCLSRRCDDKPNRLELFQLVVNSWELIKAYSELVDPIEQKERFEEQTRMREAGDEEAMYADDEFVSCMEYGMPIMSGAGLGIDRFLGILCNVTNIRDTVYFPLIKPKKERIN